MSRCALHAGITIANFAGQRYLPLCALPYLNVDYGQSIVCQVSVTVCHLQSQIETDSVTRTPRTRDKLLNKSNLKKVSAIRRRCYRPNESSCTPSDSSSLGRPIDKPLGLYCGIKLTTENQSMDSAHDSDVNKI